MPRSHAPTVKQFPSKYVPKEMLADFLLNPEKVARAVMSEDDLPPPIPEDARSNVLDLSDIQARAGERVSQMVNEERMRSAYRRPFRRGGRRSTDQAPRIINAKFPGKCAELDTDIEVGDRILWKPGSRMVYCANSERFQAHEEQLFERTHS